MNRFLLGFTITLGLMLGILYWVTLPAGTEAPKANVIESSDIRKIESNEKQSPRPTQADGLYKLGLIAFENAQYAQALSFLREAHSLDPEHSDTSVYIGRTQIKLSQFESAKQHFDQLPPEETEVAYYQGILSAYFGDYERMKERLNTTIQKGDQPELAQNATNFLASLSEYELAEDPHPSFLKTLMGRSFAETDEPEMAISLIYTVLREQGDYRDAWIILGYAYLSQNKFEEARDALIHALELDPTKAETRYFLGLSYFGLDQYNDAIPQLELAIEAGFEPKVQAYQKLGDVAVLAEAYQTAATAYEKVLVLNPSDIEGFIRPIWLSIEKLDNARHALELAEQATSEHPNEAMSYNLLGWAQLADENEQEAEQTLNYALVLDPNLAAAHYNMGLLLEKRGDSEGAKIKYQRAHDLDKQGSIGHLAAERYNSILNLPES